MVFERVKQRIEYLRQQPEHVRLQAATRYTIIAGIILVILWLVILLPLQLRGVFQNTTETATPESSSLPTP